MWMVFSRAPRPNVPVWPGRRALAMLDALLWPALAVALIAHLGPSAGVAGQVATSGLVVVAVRRLFTAAAANERYRFATARLATALLWSLMFAGVLMVAR